MLSLTYFSNTILVAFRLLSNPLSQILRIGPGLLEYVCRCAYVFEDEGDGDDDNGDDDGGDDV